MKRAALALLLCLIAWTAAAAQQSVTVIGPVTPGDCTAFSSTTVLKDSGSPCGGGGGGGITIGAPVSGGSSNCIVYDLSSAVACSTALPNGTTATTQTSTDNTTKVATTGFVQSVLNTISGIFRRILPTAQYYVDPAGSTSSTCGQSSGAGACSTLNAFVAAVSPFDLFLQAVQVNIANGTYAGMVCGNPWVGGGTVSLVGNTTTPTSVLVNATSNARAFSFSGGCNATLQGISVASSGGNAGVPLIEILLGSVVTMSAMDFGTIPSLAEAIYIARKGSYGEVNDSVGVNTIHSGAAGNYFGQASHQAELRFNCTTACLKYTGSSTYNQYNLFADVGSIIGTSAATFNLNGFVVTGNQYKAISSGNVQWNGNSPPLDSDIPGTTNSGVMCFGALNSGAANSPDFCIFGSTGTTSLPIIYGGSLGFCVALQNKTGNTFCVSNAGVPSFPLSPLPTSSGGTGNVSPTAHSVPINAGASPQTSANPGTAGNVLTSNGASADPTFQAVSSGDSAAKAWVNFVGAGCSGTCTSNASYNVSSVTRSATGNYTVNFTTPFSSATSYMCSVTVQYNGGTTSVAGSVNTGAVITTTSIGILATGVASGIYNATDPPTVHVVCFGRQ